MTPDDLATPDDHRGMATLRRLLRERGIEHPARDAAQALLAAPSPIVIATGFPVRGRPETDGPPGAFTLARALLSLGRPVTFASWPEVLAPLIDACPDASALDITSHAAPLPATLVTIEVCGQGSDGVYRNMRGDDISALCPRFERALGPRSLVSIGDGGNEVGFGSAPAGFYEQLSPPFAQPTSTTAHLVPASVSNWGAYAVVTWLSLLSAKPLLPPPSALETLVASLVARGFVDGFSGLPEPLVDGRPLAHELALLEAMRSLCTSMHGQLTSPSRA